MDLDMINSMMHSISISESDTEALKQLREQIDEEIKSRELALENTNEQTGDVLIPTIYFRQVKEIYLRYSDIDLYAYRLQQRYVCEESGAEEWKDVQIVEQ